MCGDRLRRLSGSDMTASPTALRLHYDHGFASHGSQRLNRSQSRSRGRLALKKTHLWTDTLKHPHRLYQIGFRDCAMILALVQFWLMREYGQPVLSVHVDIQSQHTQSKNCSLQLPGMLHIPHCQT